MQDTGKQSKTTYQNTFNGQVKSPLFQGGITMDYLNENGGRIYDASIHHGSRIVLAHMNRDKTSCVRVTTEASIRLESQKTGEYLISDIGSYYDQRQKQMACVQHLGAGARADETTLLAVNEIRTSNYQSLDKRFSLVERYNAHVSEEGRNADAKIQSFRGTKEELDRLRSAADRNGSSIYSKEELDAIEECVAANGYNVSSGTMSNTMLRGAESLGRARMATGVLEEYQRSGVNTIAAGVRVGKGGIHAVQSLRYARMERRAARDVKNIDSLLNGRSELLRNRNQKGVKKTDKKLARYREQLGGASDANELRARARAAQENAHKLRRQRKEKNRATSGMSRTEKKLVMNRIRQDDMILRHGGASKELVKQGDKLQKKLAGQRSRKAVIDRVAKRLGRTLAGRATHQAFLAANAIKSTALTAIKGLAAALAPVIGIILLFAFVITFLIILISGVLFLFMEENTDSGKSDLQIVNEYINEYEAQQLDLLDSVMRSVTRENYPNGYTSRGGYVTVESTTCDIIDEYGLPAGICNCMQTMTLYRYYYLFADGSNSDEISHESFWTGNFKSKMKQAWNETHHITTRGIFGIKHTGKKWTPNKVKYQDLIITGALDGGGVYHGNISDCNTPFTYTVGSGEDAYDVTVCPGHVDVAAKVQVDTDLKNIAKGSRLEGRFGVNIEYDEFSDSEIAEIADFIGTYEDGYADGCQNYADFEIYFGSAQGILNAAEATAIIRQLEDSYGPLSERQKAVIETALSGCGKFTYGASGHGNCGLGVKGGVTDCSGYASWVHNNCGQYSNTSLCLTTNSWAQYGTYNWSMSTLPPGSLLIRGDKNTQAAYKAGGASTGTGNHAVIWIGYIEGKPMIVDCTSGNGIDGSSYRQRDVSGFKTALPIGTTSVW